MIRAGILAACLCLAVPAAAAVPCRTIDQGTNRYTVCEVSVADTELRLFLKDTDGSVLGQFSAVDQMLEAEGKQLAFAMNAGMYHQDRSPVGYYVENETEVMHAVPNAGPGNFGMLPNGIFCIRPERADVMETRRFLDAGIRCTHATQSGPMLVIDGALHPRFLPDSTSRYLRNGVGTTPDGRKAVFVISHNPVTFHEFGRFFLDDLGLSSALYLDGNVSRLHAPALGRSDQGFSMGPIVGAVVDLAE